ncbi:NHLP family bacteriocin export ABC transporter peptidase/permease/ATPase subunit [Candidatus Formimonas warabiya]|uniref:NHLP family bacteriocin export ABC transporter peptidase/permease/ATPase subunit n=1 Tax=Formimonas warabiya TaxID=1761012 RepID=A0A3G1KNA2_FORW1|nr:NHLP family bacteriocin export ABC transporter peptidase/permease/ATPase subunit [Candidatus Formimonas warabiya]ATW23937.1 NHLP family bacteriocin export ABC transporter peptidase/permease/ATPase subunit [Candidatus Formimonas warabiya]
MSKIARVPVVIQMEALECGAAALCMILAYHGKWLPLEQVRRDCGVSRDGASAKNIIKAARAYGFKAAGYRMETAMLRESVLPAIIHWNFNHFVVLNGFKKDKVVLNDPARGTVEVSLDEFDKAFTGIVLQFEKSEGFQPEGKPKSVLSFAKKRLEGSFVVFIFVVLIGILTAVAGMVPPLFSRIFMDNILSGKNPEWLVPFLAAMMIMILFQFAVAFIEGVYWLKIEGRFAITANAEFMWHVLRLPVEFFSQRFAGDIVSRQISNQQIAATLIKQLAPIFMSVCLLVVYLTVMINYSVLLTIIGVAAVLLNVLAMRITAKKQVNLSRTVEASAGKLAGATMSGIEMIETIKASGAENGFFERWAGYYAKQHNAQVAITKFEQYFAAIPLFLQQIANIAILMAGVYLILDGLFTIGMLLAFQGIFTLFLTPVNQLIGVGQSFMTMRSLMERVEDVLNYRPDVFLDQQEAETEGKLSGAVEIKNLTFGYSKLSEPLIHDFSISIKPGSAVAFVGGSGSGKSTLAKLITGLYAPWSGEILFDGRRREDISEYTLKSSVAMVDQEITLFEDTVANNIRMWDSSIEDFTVILAARDADIHDTIVSRPDGYAYIMKEGGKNFSGGQRQRLEIARVLAQEPTVIILDESTSALDAKTEAEVMRNIRNIGATCIVIAHRLSTIRDCDQIVVLDRGVVVERGTHEELYARGGKYSQLVTSE